MEGERRRGGEGGEGGEGREGKKDEKVGEEVRL